MPSYSLTDAAKADLAGIIDYTIETWDQNQTAAYLDGLDKLADSLADTPKLGKSCDDLQAGLLAFPYESHVPYYVVTPGGITILRVLHKSMNTALHFRRT